MPDIPYFTAGSACILDSWSKFEAIHELIAKTDVFKSLPDLSDFEDSVILREKQQCTGFGHGVAVAHAKYDNAASIEIALGISKKGIQYDSFDNELVHLMFLISSPPSLQDEYLIILSALIKIVRNKEFRENLILVKHASNAEKMLHEALIAGLNPEITESN